MVGSASHAEMLSLRQTLRPKGRASKLSRLQAQSRRAGQATAFTREVDRAVSRANLSNTHPPMNSRQITRSEREQATARSVYQLKKPTGH